MHDKNHLKRQGLAQKASQIFSSNTSVQRSIVESINKHFLNFPTTCKKGLFLHIIIHTYIHAYIHTYIRTYIHTYIRTYIHTYIHTNIHTYIHAYIYTYIHTS